MSTPPTHDRAVEDMRAIDARLAISRHVGRKESPRSELSLKTLNSIHRYVIGEFAYQPKLHGTGLTPDRAELRRTVVAAIVARGDFPVLQDYLEGADGRSFQRDELRALLRALRAVPDERPDN